MGSERRARLEESNETLDFLRREKTRLAAQGCRVVDTSSLFATLTSLKFCAKRLTGKLCQALRCLTSVKPSLGYPDNRDSDGDPPELAESGSWRRIEIHVVWVMHQRFAWIPVFRSYGRIVL